MLTKATIKHKLCALSDKVVSSLVENTLVWFLYNSEMRGLISVSCVDRHQKMGSNSTSPNIAHFCLFPHFIKEVHDNW